MDYDQKKISEVLNRFGIGHDSFAVETLRSGHINATYKIDVCYQGKSDSYILQKVNTYVFSDPVGIMSNIAKVTGHIRNKLIQEGVDPTGRVLNFVTREDGTNYYNEGTGFWRIYHYVSDTVTYNKAEDLGILRNAGTSFGIFQKQLSDFPMDELIDTLPNFHNTPARMENFFRACERDVMGRSKEVEKELALFRENEELWSILEKDRQAGRLPLRVTHNDTKYNNILIHKKTGEAACVIDLDTVNPGLCAYDFGDAIRFSANKTLEDDPDLSKVGLDLELYEAFASGFIPVVKDFCSPRELESLALGAVTMTFEVGVRFLEDYVNGDKYFKIGRPLHNLERGRNQLALALDMKKHLDQMQEINRALSSK